MFLVVVVIAITVSAVIIGSGRRKKWQPPYVVGPINGLPKKKKKKILPSHPDPTFMLHNTEVDEQPDPTFMLHEKDQTEIQEYDG